MLIEQSTFVNEPQKALSPRIINHLDTTSKWVRFVGILGLISSALSVISIVWNLAKPLSVYIQYASKEAFFWLFLGIIFYIAMTVFSFYVSYVLYDYGKQTSNFVKTKDYDNLAKSFERQLSYWRIAAVLVSLMLFVYLLMLAYNIIVSRNAAF